MLTEDGKPADNPFWGPLQGKYLSAVYYYCTNKTRIFQKQILMLRFSVLWSDFRIMIHSNTFKSNSRKIQTECGLANLYANWWILKQRVDVIKMKIIVYIQNPKSLPHVTWVTPNIRKNIKVKENFMFYFYLFISWDGFETWILKILEQQLLAFQKYEETLKKCL